MTATEAGIRPCPALEEGRCCPRRGSTSRQVRGHDSFLNICTAGQRQVRSPLRRGICSRGSLLPGSGPAFQKITFQGPQTHCNLSFSHAASLPCSQKSSHLFQFPRKRLIIYGGDQPCTGMTCCRGGPSGGCILILDHPGSSKLPEGLALDRRGLKNNETV